MGKAALLAVVAAVIGGTFMMISTQRSQMETRETQSEYEYNVLARNAAESGMSRAMSAVRRDIVGTISSDMSGGATSYEAHVERNGTRFEIESTGKSGQAEHQIQANMVLGSPLDAALTLSADSVDFTGGTRGSYTVSGKDRLPASRGGGAGFMADIYGIRSETASRDLVSAFAEGKPGDAINGESITASFNSEKLGDRLEVLYEEAKEKADYPLVDALEIGRHDLNVGRENDPKIVVVQGGDVTVDFPVEGYGVLVIEDGDLTINSGGFQWEGIVLMRKEEEEGISVKMSNGAQVTGGFIAYQVGATGNRVCKPDFEIVGDQTRPEVPYRVSAEVLGAVIQQRSGGDLLPVTARLSIEGEVYDNTAPWGYDMNNGGYNLAGTESHFWNPEDRETPFFPGGSGISIDARSWNRGRKIYETVGYREERVCTGYLFWKRCWTEPVPIREWTGEYEWGINMSATTGTHHQQIQVLRDGDRAPNAEGHFDQGDAKSFVSKYIDENERMSLAANQSIYLFELGTNRIDPYDNITADDFQDLVVLVTMTAEDPADCTWITVGNDHIDFDIGGGAAVQYSSEAVARLGQKLEYIRNRTKATVTSRSEGR